MMPPHRQGHNIPQALAFAPALASPPEFPHITEVLADTLRLDKGWGMTQTFQKGVVLAQDPLYRLGYMDRPSHKHPKGLQLQEPDQGGERSSS